MTGKAPWPQWARGHAIGVPSAGLSLGWVLASRASLRFTRREGDTPRRRAKQEQSSLPVRKAGKSVAKEGPFFVQRMGSTSGGLLHQQLGGPGQAVRAGGA